MSKGLSAVFVQVTLRFWTSQSLGAGPLCDTGLRWSRWCWKDIRERPAGEMDKEQATILERDWTKSRVLPGPPHPQCHSLLSSTWNVKAGGPSSEFKQHYLLLWSWNPSSSSIHEKFLHTQRMICHYPLGYMWRRPQVICNLTVWFSDWNWRAVKCFREGLPE